MPCQLLAGNVLGYPAIKQTKNKPKKLIPEHEALKVKANFFSKWGQKTKQTKKEPQIKTTEDFSYIVTCIIIQSGLRGRNANVKTSSNFNILPPSSSYRLELLGCYFRKAVVQQNKNETFQNNELRGT